MSMTNIAYSVSKASDSLSPPHMHRTKSCIDTNYYYPQQNPSNAYTNSLLMELNHWQQAHRLVDERTCKEEKTYRDVECALIEKIEKYDERFDKKMANLIRYRPEAQDVDVEETIDRIVDLELRISEMKQQIHRKKWFEDRNGMID